MKEIFDTDKEKDEPYNGYKDRSCAYKFSVKKIGVSSTLRHIGIPIYRESLGLMKISQMYGKL